MTRIVLAAAPVLAIAVVLLSPPPTADAADPPRESSYMPVKIDESFQQIMDRRLKEKKTRAARHEKLLAERYDFADRKHPNAKMSRGKPVQAGVRAKLPANTDWDALAKMAPDQIRERNLFPRGFMPLPHPDHEEGGMVFPDMMIKEVAKQDGPAEAEERLKRFDVDFDLPERFLPEFPPAVFLTTRPDLGDVSQGKLITNSNFYELFNGILNPKDIDGLRLLVAQFPQQQFNATEDRRTKRPSRGVACFDCHANGATNGATHLVGDIRPQENRRRIDTPSLRGVNIQQLFGSQRALHTVEDFTEFEQRAAYFDGDIAIAMKKGVNILERATQVHHMAEMQNLLDFPPAAKLDLFGKLDPAKATPEELRGQELFFGKAKCGSCHAAPYYTDNSMHDLKVERFYNPQRYDGMLATKQGPMKTTPLRGIKDTPPYLHDGRLLTLDDSVEFFNLVLGTKLSTQEKRDLVSFMLTL